MTDPDTRIDMTGKTVVITGASSGIGAAAARRLAVQGATVVPVGRSPQRTAQIAAEPLIADFAHLDQVLRLADTLLDRYPRIDVLANNAGGLVSTRQRSADGHELTFQTNHLAPFLLTTLLLPRLRDNALQAPVRIITTSSLGNRFGKLRLDGLEWAQRRYGGGWLAYSTTKLMNILFTLELARRTQGTGIQAFCFHPTAIHRGQRGPIGTATRFADSSRLLRLIPQALLRRVRLTGEDGAEPLIWLAATPDAGRQRRLLPRLHAERKGQPAGERPRAGTGGFGNAPQNWCRSSSGAGHDQAQDRRARRGGHRPRRGGSWSKGPWPMRNADMSLPAPTTAGRLARRSLEQKARMLTGASFWTLHQEPGDRAALLGGLRRAGRGARPGAGRTRRLGEPASCDRDRRILGRRAGRAAGRLLASEARRKGVDVVQQVEAVADLGLEMPTMRPVHRYDGPSSSTTATASRRTSNASGGAPARQGGAGSGGRGGRPASQAPCRAVRNAGSMTARGPGLHGRLRHLADGLVQSTSGRTEHHGHPQSRSRLISHSCMSTLGPASGNGGSGSCGGPGRRRLVPERCPKRAAGSDVPL